MKWSGAWLRPTSSSAPISRPVSHCWPCSHCDHFVSSGGRLLTITIWVMQPFVLRSLPVVMSPMNGTLVRVMHSNWFIYSRFSGGPIFDGRFGNDPVSNASENNQERRCYVSTIGHNWKGNKRVVGGLDGDNWKTTCQNCPFFLGVGCVSSQSIAWWINVTRLVLVFWTSQNTTTLFFFTTRHAIQFRFDPVSVPSRSKL